MQSCLPVYFLLLLFLVRLLLKMDQVAEFLTPLLRKIPPSCRFPSRIHKVKQRLFHHSGPSPSLCLGLVCFLCLKGAFCLVCQGLLEPESVSRATAALFLSPCGASERPGNIRVRGGETGQVAKFRGSFSHWGPITCLGSDLESPFCWLCDLWRVTEPL